MIETVYNSSILVFQNITQFDKKFRNYILYTYLIVIFFLFIEIEPGNYGH